MTESNFNRISKFNDSRNIFDILRPERVKKNKTVITNLLTMICGATAVGEGFFCFVFLERLLSGRYFARKFSFLIRHF